MGALRQLPHLLMVNPTLPTKITRAVYMCFIIKNNILQIHSKLYRPSSCVTLTKLNRAYIKVPVYCLVGISTCYTYPVRTLAKHHTSVKLVQQ